MTGPPRRRPPKPPVAGIRCMGVGGAIPRIPAIYHICDYVRPVFGACCEILIDRIPEHVKKLTKRCIFLLTVSKLLQYYGLNIGGNPAPQQRHGGNHARITRTGCSSHAGADRGSHTRSGGTVQQQQAQRLRGWQASRQAGRDDRDRVGLVHRGFPRWPAGQGHRGLTTEGASAPSLFV